MAGRRMRTAGNQVKWWVEEGCVWWTCRIRVIQDFYIGFAPIANNSLEWDKYQDSYPRIGKQELGRSDHVHYSLKVVGNRSTYMESQKNFALGTTQYDALACRGRMLPSNRSKKRYLISASRLFSLCA